MSQAKTAAAYIRVSTDEQLEYSPDSQIKKISEYAEKNGLHIPGEFVFVDEGISGRRAEKRPGFMKMIALAKSKPRAFDVILVWKFSRFARNREDSVIYKSMLRKQYGIDVISVSEQIGEDKTSILIEALIEAMDEYYSLNLADEVKRGMNEKFSRGGVVSQPPFGYRMGEGVFIPDEDRACFVKMIFEDFVAGMSCRKIAEKLNNMGIRSSRGNKFENRTVEYILSNPVYTGKLRRNTKGCDKSDRYHCSPDTVIVEGMHTPIINNELYKAATEKLTAARNRHIKNSHHDNAGFMLRGIVRCSSCGATLVQSQKGKSIQCHRYARGQCSISHSIAISKINTAVIEKLSCDFDDCSFTFYVKGKSESDLEDIVKNLIEKEHRKLSLVKEAFEAGIDSLDEYKKSKNRIENRIAGLEKALKAHSENDVKINLKIDDIIHRMNDGSFTDNAKNTLLRSVISGIVFDKKNMTIRIKYFQ